MSVICEHGWIQNDCAPLHSTLEVKNALAYCCKKVCSAGLSQTMTTRSKPTQLIDSFTDGRINNTLFFRNLRMAQ
jgi:hypothetical protein